MIRKQIVAVNVGKTGSVLGVLHRSHLVSVHHGNLSRFNYKPKLLYLELEMKISEYEITILEIEREPIAMCVTGAS